MWSLAGFFGALALWEAGAVLVGNPGVFPHLGEIVTALAAWGNSGLLIQDLFESLPQSLRFSNGSHSSWDHLGLILGLTRIDCV